jgi:hypothetical protein
VREASFDPWKQVGLKAFDRTPRTKQASSATGHYVLRLWDNVWITTVPESPDGTDLTVN